MPTNPSDPSYALLINGLLIPCEEIQLISGENGFSLGSPHFVGWKQNTIVTPTKRYIIKDIPAHNALFFKSWLQQCSRAVGLRPDGSVILPKVVLSPDDDPFTLISDALKSVRREFAIQIRKIGLGATIIFPLICLEIFADVAGLFGNNRRNAQGFMAFLLFILFELCLLLFFRAAFLIIRRYAALRTLRHVLKNCRTNPELLASLLHSSGNSIPRNSPNSLFPSFFALLAALFFWIPFAGILFSLLGLLLVIRESCWPRTVSIISLIISTLATLYVIILLLLSHH